MRTSQKVLLCGVVLVFGLVTAGVLGVRAVVNQFLGSEAYANTLAFDGDDLELSPDLTGFDGILVRGAWDIRIESGDEWRVEVSVPEDIEDSVQVGVNDGRLVLGVRRSARPWWMREHDGSNRARITMPALAGIRVEGAGNIAVGRFDGDSLLIDIAGAANVESARGEYDNVTVRIGGAGNVDLGGLDATNANISLSGAGNVELSMAGGELTGDMAGFGRLHYQGEVSREAVNVSGFSRIDRPRG